MKSKRYLVILALLSSYFAIGQMTNDGGNVKILPGTYMLSKSDVINANSGVIVNEGTLISTQSINNNSGSSISGDGQYTITGNWTNAGTFNAGASTVTFNGAGISNLTSGGSPFYKLELGKDATFNLILIDNSTINNLLDFTANNSKVELGANNLTLTTSATLANFDDNNYIVTNGLGQLIKDGLTNFTFPLGADGTSYNPLVLIDSVSTDTVGVRCLPNLLDMGNSGSAITENVINTSWEVTENTAGGSSMNMTTQWAGSDETATFDRTNCDIIRHDGSNWGFVNQQLAGATGADPYTRTKDMITQLGVFGVADGDLLGCTDSTAHNYNASATLNDGTCQTCSDGIKNGDESGIDCGGTKCMECPPECTAAGGVIITEIMPDPDAVSDANGEWFEVFNTTGMAVDLRGWVISDDGTDSHTIDTNVIIPANGYIVLARNGSSATNGGVIAAYDYTGFTLGNSDDEVVLGCSGSEIDRVNYDGGPVFPDPTGASMSLNPDSLDAMANNNGANWCEATSTFGSGDNGTPGLANDACPNCSDGILNGDEVAIDCGGAKCMPCVMGCMDSLAHNYDSLAVVDDGSCMTCSDGLLNGDEVAIDCGGAKCMPCVLGCMDSLAHNYDSLAVVDDGSCMTCSDGLLNGDEVAIDCGGAKCMPCVMGCMDSLAHNYDSLAVVDDGSCMTCSDGLLNGDEVAIDCGGAKCMPCVLGCMDSLAHNYDSLAVVDDGSCMTCSDGLLNGDEVAIDCGGAKCMPCVMGCMDSLAHNYDSLAVVDDGSCMTCSDGLLNGDEVAIDCGGAKCMPCVMGCMDSLAHNYDSLAVVDDSSCMTCSDGVQNGDEEGMDCGGTNPSCIPCDCTLLPDINSFCVRRHTCSGPPIKVDWADVPGAIKYGFHGARSCGGVECNPMLDRERTTSGFNVPGTVPNNFNVLIRLRAMCADSTWGEWTSLTLYTISDAACATCALPAAAPANGDSDETIGISQHVPGSRNLHLFPNPALDILNVAYHIDGQSGNAASLEVFDILGQNVLVRRTKENNIQLDIRELRSGSYFIRVSQGSEQLSKRFIKGPGK